MNHTEIELKYKVPVSKKIEILKLLENLQGKEICQQAMKATYMDTHNNDLLKNKIALRIRNEGDKTYATVKTKGVYHDGLYSRKEWNVEILENRDISISEIFINTEIGKDFKEILEGKALEEKIITEFTRTKTIIHLADCTLEVAFDQGIIHTKKGSEDLCELEIELLEGNQSHLTTFGNNLAEQFQLAPEGMSKYARGLKLLGLV